MKLIAFKTYAECPPDQKPEGVQDKFVWYFKEITESQKADFVSLKHQVMTVDEYRSYVESIAEDYAYWYENFYAPRQDDKLRVIALVEEKFKAFHPSKIDFRRHLKPNVSLSKVVNFQANGRPLEALYEHEGQLVARIRFEFEVDQFNFMTKRIENLGYFTEKGELQKEWIIWSQDYLPTVPHHQSERIAERVEARSNIMNQIKSVLDVAVAAFYFQQGSTYSEILVIAGQFYKTYNEDIQMFINTGSPALRLRIESELLEGVLAIPISVEQTVKDFLIERLSY